MKKSIVIILGILVVNITLSAYALRCKNKVITTGTSIAKVKEFCPPPEYVESFSREVSQGQAVIDNTSTSTSDVVTSTTQTQGSAIVSETKDKLIVHGEKWFMNFGPQRLRMILVFENGVLVDEQTDSDYGN